ncbi:hypothetical protein Dimus_022805 [Dionaea muscipula]
MEVEVADNSLLVVSDNGELYDIDDVDPYIDIVVEKTVSDIFENISNKVNIDLPQEVVKALEEKEAADKEKSAAHKAKTYRIRKTTKKSKYVDDEPANPKDDISAGMSRDHDKIDEYVIATPQDDVLLTTIRDSEGEATRMEIVLYHTPTSTSNQEYVPTRGECSTYINMSAHIEQAVKCMLSAIEEQSTVMKSLLKHPEFHGSQD